VLTETQATYLGYGEHYDGVDLAKKFSIPFYDPEDENSAVNDDAEQNCLYSFDIYPTTTFAEKYESSQPVLLTVIVASAFALMLVTFIVYDIFVFRRNKKILNEVVRSQAIVSSMFPSSVQDRLFASDKDNGVSSEGGTKNRLRNFLTEGIDNQDFLSTKPIADLFVATTIMFADLCGFTAWSSTREPSQVRPFCWSVPDYIQRFHLTQSKTSLKGFHLARDDLRCF
jgi:hypothetical protein